jgi:RHS repeat-associated protein
LTTSTSTAGIRHYELTNHLGNVSVIVSDKKLLSANQSQKLYLPDVISYQDYYPFGMVMTDRSGSLPDATYRYGYNGKENDNEVNQQDYGFRVYDPRVGRFLSVDARGELLRLMAPIKPNGICQQKSPENDITFCQIEIGIRHKY